MTSTVASTRSVGTSALRVEDVRILTGGGRYVDDLKVPGMLHAAFLRSPFPHARIVNLDVSAAEQAEGVVAVFTGADMAERTEGVIPKMGPPGFKWEPVFGLAIGKVLFVGDPVAIVVATDRYLAEDAVELIDVDYDQLQAIATFDQGLDPDGPVLFETLGSNLVFEMHAAFGEVEESFAAAETIVRETFTQHRVAQVPMEGRGGVAQYDAETGEFVYYTGNQAPHTAKAYISQALGIPLEQTRSVNGDIGGAFGLKIFTHREDLAVCAAAYWLAQPVKWIEDRNEHLLSSGQAREARMSLEAAVLRDGTILALRGELVVDQGAYVGVPVARRRSRRPGHQPDAGPVQPARLRADVEGHREQQMHLQRLPRAVGDRDLVARADDRHDRARTRPRSGRRTGQELRRQRRHRQDAQRYDPAQQLLRRIARAGTRRGRLQAAAGRAGAGPRAGTLCRYRVSRPSSRPHPDPLPVGA